MKPPAFQFYADDFIGGTVDLSVADVGAYIRLLCYQWGRGSIPETPVACERVAGGPVSPEVLAKFPDRKNPRLERERVKQAEYRSSQSENGRAGASARWRRHADGNSIANSGAIIPPMADRMAKNGSPSPSPSPSPILAPLVGERRGEKIPESLQIPEFTQAWSEWINHLESEFYRGGAIPVGTEFQHLRMCLEWGAPRAIAAIRHTIGCGRFSMLCEPKVGQSAAATAFEPTAASNLR